jgi:hypothetical protein
VSHIAQPRRVRNSLGRAGFTSASGGLEKAVRGRSAKLPSASCRPPQFLADSRNRLQFHPLANIFPLMEGAEFDALVDDIRTKGLLDDIVLCGGLILDGRNRYRACLAAGVEPRFIDRGPSDWGSSAEQFVISANIRRRHLDPETKIKILAQLVAAQPEKSDRQHAKEAGVSHPTIAKARKTAEATGKALPVDKRVGADGKARRRPPKKKAKAKRQETRAERKAREQNAAAHKAWVVEIVALQAEAEQLAADLIALDRNLAHRLHAHLGDSMWLKDTLRRGLGLEGEDTAEWITPPPAQGNDADAQASAEKRKAEMAALDDVRAITSDLKIKTNRGGTAYLDPGPIPECLRRGAP